MARTPIKLLAGMAVGVLLLAAGCGDDDDASPESGATTAPAGTEPVVGTDAPVTTTGTAPSSTAIDAVADTTDDTAGTEPESDGPTRIVSLSPTHTEILFAIGAGDQVIAVDDQSNYPPEAEAVQTDLSGFEPNVESIAGYEPDLVVTSGGNDLADQLDDLGIEVWEGPAARAFPEAYDQIAQLGDLTGHVDEATTLVTQMKADFESIAASVPPTETPLTVYHELGPEGYSANSATFIGEVYFTLGLQNIADYAEGDTGGYPQLNSETIIAANPDLIFLADSKCCGESLETVAARPGWADIAAVVNGNVFPMDDDIASRWGPRTVDYMQSVADAVKQATSVPAGG